MRLSGTATRSTNSIRRVGTAPGLKVSRSRVVKTGRQPTEVRRASLMHMNVLRHSGGTRIFRSPLTFSHDQ
jgi:hypothetical protein